MGVGDTALELYPGPCDLEDLGSMAHHGAHSDTYLVGTHFNMSYLFAITSEIR